MPKASDAYTELINGQMQTCEREGMHLAEEENVRIRKKEMLNALIN